MSDMRLWFFECKCSQEEFATYKQAKEDAQSKEARIRQLEQDVLEAADKWKTAYNSGSCSEFANAEEELSAAVRALRAAKGE